MKSLPYAALLLIAGILLGAYIGNKPPQPAGDIVEYYGTTESVMRHGSIELQPQDQSELSRVLHPEYFSNPGYYLTGLDGNRYPMHFVSYSLLLLPIRWILSLAALNPLLIFSIGNSMLLIGALAYIMRYMLVSDWQRMLLLITALTSPLISFLWWPGPDIFSMSFLLVALFLFYKDKLFPAAAIAALASWQSQPILIVSIGMLFWALYANRYETKKTRWVKYVSVTGIIGAVALVPYIYNYVLFGTWTPWTILQDFWTQTYGFGLHNISLQKLFEQIFDLNVGLFWYMPILTITGAYCMFLSIKRESKGAWVAILAMAALLAYQTNPAWHYGTSGFGPSRHAIVLLPFLITAFVRHAKLHTMWIGVVMLTIASQAYTLSFNNYIFPLFTNTLHHSPIARFVLDLWPAWYNPTPEIFVDRTNHTDLDHPTSAIYKTDGACKKAYVLVSDIDRIIAECGPMQKIVQTSVVNPKTDGFYIEYE